MNQLIILFKDGTSVSEMRNIVSEQGLTVNDTMQEKLERVGIPSNSMPPMCLATFSNGSVQYWIDKLSKLSNIEIVEINLKGKF